MQGQLPAREAGQLLRLPDPFPQRQGLIEVAVRLGGRAEPLGLRPGPHRRRERSRDVVAGQVVLGQLGRGTRVGGQPFLIGQQPGQHAVQPGALTGQQVPVDRLTQQRVPEGVPVRAVRDQELLRYRLTDRVLVAGHRQPGRDAD